MFRRDTASCVISTRRSCFGPLDRGSRFFEEQQAMKRLFTFGLMLSLLTATVFAEETKPTLSVGGNLTWGFTYNTDNEEYSDVLDWATIYFSGRTDEFNSYRVLLEFYGEMPEDVYVAEAMVTTDLARYLGLDVYGLSLAWRNGFSDAGPSVYSAGTRYGFDEVTDSGETEIDTSWMSEMTLGVYSMHKPVYDPGGNSSRRVCLISLCRAGARSARYHTRQFYTAPDFTFPGIHRLVNTHKRPSFFSGSRDSALYWAPPWIQ